jgi:hypothetical protein
VLATSQIGKNSQASALQSFMSGACTAARITRMPVARASASKLVPNLSSRSRIKNRGAVRNAVALRSCCVIHACEGPRVVAASTTLRVASSMKTNAKIGRKNTS